MQGENVIKCYDATANAYADKLFDELSKKTPRQATIKTIRRRK